MRIVIRAFMAMFPVVNKKRLGDNAASFAQNLSIDSGALKPIYDIDVETAITLPESPYNIIDAYLWKIANNEYWLQFGSSVDVIRSPINDDVYKKIYWSGDTERSEDGDVLYSYTPNIYTGGTVYPVNWYKLGIPAPENKPIIDEAKAAWDDAPTWSAGLTVAKDSYILPTTAGIYIYKCTVAGVTGGTEPTWSVVPDTATNDGTAKWVCIALESFNSVSEDARVYFYTYVTKLGEESAPSPASDLAIVPHESGMVELAGLVVDAEAATGREIEKIRIYRSVVDSNGTAIALFVDEIPIAQDTYTDTKKGSELAGEMVTTSWAAPRQGMQGLGLTGNGIAYGFFEKIVCLSEPYVPYAWPRGYELSTEYDIVAIGHYDTFLIVATKGNPVIVNGIDPSSMMVQELPIMESCVSKESMVSLGYGAMYASPNGLVFASGNTAQLLTSSLWGDAEWRALNPSSIHAVEHRGKYLFFYDATSIGGGSGAYMLNPKAIESGVIHLDVTCIATHRDKETDTLYLLQDNGVLVKFDDSGTNATMTWRSKVFPLDNPVQFLAGIVSAETYNNTKFRLIGADGLPVFEQIVTSEKPFRLPKLDRQMYWCMEVESQDIVRKIGIGESVRELFE